MCDIVMTPFSFRVLFTFIYLLRIKKQHCHFIFFGPFCTYSFSHVLALPQVLPFFYFYHSCGHVHSFIILSSPDLPWLLLTHFLTVLLLSRLCFSFFYIPLLSVLMHHLPFIFFISSSPSLVKCFLFLISKAAFLKSS